MALHQNGYQDPDGIISNPSLDLDNQVGDTSEVAYREFPGSIGAAKEVVGVPVLQSDGNFLVTYQVVVQNTGGTDLSNLSVIEDFSSEFGSAFVSAGNLTLLVAPSNPLSSITLDTMNWDGDSSDEMIVQAASLLKFGDSFAVQFTVVVDPDSTGTSSVLNNQVVVSGTEPSLSGNGNVVTDLSDSGSDPDGNNVGAPGDSGGSDDPTPLYIPLLGLAKEAGDAVFQWRQLGRDIYARV